MPIVEPAPTVGVRRLYDAHDATGVPIYDGVSYCDAVRRAGAGRPLRVVPGSIKVCQWSPVVLGLKRPQGAFERSLAPRLPYPNAGLLLAPLDRFPGTPEVVIVRATASTLRATVRAIPTTKLWNGHGGRLDRSALPLLLGEEHRARGSLITAVNHLLASLAPLPTWQALTRHLFRSRAVTIAFEVVILRVLANMSICRNSTVIPLLTGRANVSYFCTGGITWGLNAPSHATSGWPVQVYESLVANREHPTRNLPTNRSAP